MPLNNTNFFLRMLAYNGGDMEAKFYCYRPKILDLSEDRRKQASSSVINAVASSLYYFESPRSNLAVIWPGRQ